VRRTFKAFTVATAGTPQPLIGTTISAAIAAGAHMIKVQVADSSMFVGEDWALLRTIAGVSPDVEERVFIAKVDDSTHVTFKDVATAFPSGSWLRLAGNYSSIFVQSIDGNTGNLYIGTSRDLVKASYTKVAAEISHVAAGSQPPSFSDQTSTTSDAEDMSQWWIDADNNTDKYLPSFGII
jgi:hypothetical protein